MTPDAIRHQLARGAWFTKLRGVYRFAGTPENWHQQARALALLCGDGAALSHETAAFLHGLDGTSLKRGEAPRSIEVTAARRRRVLLPRPHVLHLANKDVPSTFVQDLPVTTLARTMIDLCDLLPQDKLEQALDSARRRNKNFDALLLEALDRNEHRGRQNVEKLLYLTRVRRHAVDSALEVEVLRRIREASLPEPLTGFKVFDGGRYVIKLDVAYLAPRRIALHCDSREWHQGRQLDIDARQRTHLDTLGWKNLYVTWRTLDDPLWLHALSLALGL
jgi:hypothetical protein